MNFPVQVNNLSFSYGKDSVLKDLSLSFQKGKFYSIIGPNGSGKTTFLKNLSKLLDISKETVFINDQDAIKLSNKEISKNLALVPQNINIEYEFTAYDIVIMGRTPFKKRFEDYNEKDKEMVEKSMKLTSTWELRHKLITTLSGGEQQRVIAARALCQDTDIILLDEPTSHLDIQHQLGFLNIFKKLKKDITVIAVMHDLNLASLYSDEIILLEKGKIIDKGEPARVITRENIKKVYNIEVDIIRNTSNGAPYVMPVV